MTPASLRSDLTTEQRRLAEITEMIHTASLVHDDVLDECSVRRGALACSMAIVYKAAGGLLVVADCRAVCRILRSGKL